MNTYDEVLEQGEWLEDDGKRSRYLIGEDDACIWVNNDTCEIEDELDF